MRHSVTRSIAMVGFATALGLATASTHGNVLVTRDFSADPGFTGFNNTTPDQNYKYSSGTNFAGGAVGEIGGVTAREAFNSFYADARTVPGAFGVDTPMHGSGRFIIQNAVGWDHGVIVGHFNQSDIGDLLALTINEPAGAFTQSRVRAVMERDNGSNAWALTPQLDVTRNVPHTFSYVWDPTGGTTGRGLLSLTIDGITQTSEDPGGSFNLAERNGSTPVMTGAFNSWGMAVGGAPGVAGTVDVFVDDAIYNLAPEPAALTLLGMVWTTTMLRRSRGRQLRH